MPVPCEPRSTGLPDRMARRTSAPRRWRRPRHYHPGSPDTPSPRGWTSVDRDPCANHDLQSSVACWRRPESGWHQRQSLRRQPDRMRCKPRRRARTHGEKPLPHGSAHCGHAKTPNDRGWRPRCRACRTSGRQGSPALHDRATVPNGSQKHIQRPASGSSVPDRSTGAPSTNSEVQVLREARTGRERLRSCAPNDLPGSRRQDETRRTVDLGHSSNGPSWVDLAAIRVNKTESRFAVSLNRLLQQNLPKGDIERANYRPTFDRKALMWGITKSLRRSTVKWSHSGKVKNVGFGSVDAHSFTLAKRGSSSPTKRRHGVVMDGRTSALSSRSCVNACNASRSLVKNRECIAGARPAKNWSITIANSPGLRGI